MSNNIYDILKKFNNLDSVKNILTEGKKVKEGTGKCNESAKGKMCPVHGMKECAGMYEGKDKPDFLDMDKDGDTKEPMKKAAKAKSKGAVAEAVAQVEKQLNEKYRGFKKMNEGNQLPAPPDEVHLPKKGSKHGPVDVYKPKKNEDMLSPGQKKIAKMSPPPDKIDAGDFAKLRAGKQGMKKEGAGVMHYKKERAKEAGEDSFKLGDKEYPVQEGFPSVADTKKRMDDREGKTAHGKKTVTKTGVKHERDYDREETGERGRPVKDKFAKKK